MGSTGTAVPRPGRALAGLVAGLGALVAASAGVLLLVAPLLAPGDAGAPVDLASLLGRACAAALVLAWAWLALATGVCLVEAALPPASRVAPALLRPALLRPALARRFAAVLIGSGAGGLALVTLPAAASTPDSPTLAASPVTDLRPVPPRPLGGTAGEAAGGTGGLAVTAPAPAAPTVRVHAGDCLWSIAAAHLTRPRADDVAVDAAWRRLYAANRAAVGPDPHLIRPGTRLDLPSPAPTEGRP